MSSNFKESDLGRLNEWGRVGITILAANDTCDVKAFLLTSGSE